MNSPRAHAQRVRLAWFFAMLAYMIVGYFVIGRFNLERGWYLDPSLALEARIPFVPELIVAYALVYFVLVVGVFSVPVEDLDYFRRGARWLALNFTIAYAIFLLVPVKALHRPPIDPDLGLAHALTGFYYDFDAPTNLLPSLHVQMAVIGGLLCLRCGGLRALIGVTCAVVVSVSVVLVKQHYVADIALALLIVAVTARICGMGSFRPRR